MTRADPAEFEQLIDLALDHLSQLRPQRSRFSHRGRYKRSLDATLLAAAARRQGLGVLTLSSEAQLIGDGERLVGFHQNMPWSLTRLDRLVTHDKEITKQILRQHGLPVARGRLVANPEAALDWFRELAGPAVVKPVTGSGGAGITVDIRTETELLAATELPFSRQRTVIIEESIPSIDLRIMVVNRRSVAAMLRVPAHVTGDGVASIGELINRKNRIRRANAYLSRVPVKVTATAAARMAAAGLELASVLPAGERFFLHYKANLSAGGDSYEVTGMVHPEILLLAERAAACFHSVRHVGVDILAQRLDQPPAAQRCVICEVNCNNEMPIHHFPLFGIPVDAARHEIEGYLPGTSGPRRGWRRAAARLRPPARVIPRRHSHPPVAAPAAESWPGLAESLAEPLGYPAAPGFPDGDDGPADGDGWSPRQIDAAGLASALERLGAGQVRVDGRLLWVTRPGDELLMERSRSPVFAGAVSRDRPSVQRLAQAAGIVACRAVRLDPGQLTAAKQFCRGTTGPWNLRPATGRGGPLRFTFHHESALAQLWPRLPEEANSVVLEQAADGMALRMLLITGEVAACQLLLPAGLLGDGSSGAGELIAAKLQARARHPFLRYHPVRKSLLAPDSLASRGLENPTVLARGRWLPLGGPPLLDAGAETLGLAAPPDPALVGIAATIRSLVGEPPITAVTFAARAADRRTGKRHWALASIDPDPVLAGYAYPWAGPRPATDVYQLAGTALLDGPRYELVRGSIAAVG
jgi:D-alanine-D-alanine ligase-like ATP-grasp enzyme